jgi:hypothetical protein
MLGGGCAGRRVCWEKVVSGVGICKEVWCAEDVQEGGYGVRRMVWGGCGVKRCGVRRVHCEEGVCEKDVKRVWSKEGMLEIVCSGRRMCCEEEDVLGGGCA